MLPRLHSRLLRLHVSFAPDASIAQCHGSLNAYHTRTAQLSKTNPKEKALPPRPVLHDSDLIENFLKGSGPGGQKINKTSSAVQLKHIPTGIVVKYQDTRSREVNRKMARRILQDRIEELELGDEARTRVKARVLSKKKASSKKKSKRKYRALEEGKKDTEEGNRIIDEEGRVDGEIQVEEVEDTNTSSSRPDNHKGFGKDSI